MPLSFHHIGVACTDIKFECQKLKSLNYQLEGGWFVDQTQGVEGAFLVGGGPRLEILRPLTDEGVLTPWLKARTKLYHMAYTVNGDFSSQIDCLQGQGGKLIVKPIPAIAFNDAEICFLMMPNMLLIELINIEINSISPTNINKT
jgi:methylmalonyl-CoA/ethylmalonyl-CoA epimerase